VDACHLGYQFNLLKRGLITKTFFEKGKNVFSLYRMRQHCLEYTQSKAGFSAGIKKRRFVSGRICGRNHGRHLKAKEGPCWEMTESHRFINLKK
jgi:hypothetical protein